MIQPPIRPLFTDAVATAPRPPSPGPSRMPPALIGGCAWTDGRLGGNDVLRLRESSNGLPEAVVTTFEADFDIIAIDFDVSPPSP